MIIKFHPKEIESKKGLEIINKLNQSKEHEIVHASDKTPKEWQSIITSTEKLILVAPVYWWGASYVFDKWVQEVFTYGFAYTYNEKGSEGLLKKREFEMHMTHGMPKDHATPMRENITKRMEKGIFGFCDAKVAITFYDMSS